MTLDVEAPPALVDLPAEKGWHDWVGQRACGRRLADEACPTKFTELTMSKIAAENGLVGVRLGWVLTLNGFLFASYALALNSDLEADRRAHLANFQWLVSLVGFGTAAVSLAGVLAAYSAINAHKRRWIANQQVSLARAVQPFSGPGTSLVGRLPSTGFCAIISGVWLYLLIHGV